MNSRPHAPFKDIFIDNCEQKNYFFKAFSWDPSRILQLRLSGSLTCQLKGLSPPETSCTSHLAASVTLHVNTLVLTTILRMETLPLPQSNFRNRRSSILFCSVMLSILKITVDRLVRFIKSPIKYVASAGCSPCLQLAWAQQLQALSVCTNYRALSWHSHESTWNSCCCGWRRRKTSPRVILQTVAKQSKNIYTDLPRAYKHITSHYFFIHLWAVMRKNAPMSSNSL